MRVAVYRLLNLMDTMRYIRLVVSGAAMAWLAWPLIALAEQPVTSISGERFAAKSEAPGLAVVSPLPKIVHNGESLGHDSSAGIDAAQTVRRYSTTTGPVRVDQRSMSVDSVDALPGAPYLASFWQDDVACGDYVCEEMNLCGDARAWYVGLEVTVVEPTFEDNPAFTVISSDGQSFENFSDSDFDFGMDVAPRALLGLDFSDGVGLRTTWWYFDHSAEAAGTPPGNGFGLITHPAFGDVDISTTIPPDTFSASSEITAYTIDFEITKSRDFAAWELGVSSGVRYARIEQSYAAQVTDSSADALGRIDFRHENEGFGPTISLWASTPVSQHIDLFCKGRGSLLGGKSNRRLTAVEDLDLATPYTTTEDHDSDRLLPIAEVQLGLHWAAQQVSGQQWQPFATVAMEGQHWNGAGNASSENGNVGFFGLAASAGLVR